MTGQRPLDAVVTCAVCRQEVIDREWAAAASTTLLDLMAAHGAHYATDHPEYVDRFVASAERHGLVRPPPTM